jgi:anti-anti-sigma factor
MLVVHATYDVMIQVSGVLDGDSASAFAGCVTAAIADSPRRVVLEVSALEAVDEAGVACFRAAVREAKAHDVGIVLESPSPVVLARLRAGDRVPEFVVR